MAFNLPATHIPATWRLRTARGIPYCFKSIEGESSYDETSVTETYVIAAAHIIPFTLESFPLSRIENDLPTVNPRHLPGVPRLLTRSISWRSVDGEPMDPFLTDQLTSASGTYQTLAEVTVQYDNSRKTQDQSDFNIEVSGDVAGEFLHTTAPIAQWQLNPAADTVENREQTVPVTFVVPETEWSVRWDYIDRKFFEDTLIGRLRGALGKVNSSAFSLLYSAPIETVLFVGFSLEERFAPQSLFGDADEEEGERDRRDGDDVIDDLVEIGFFSREELLAFREQNRLPPVKLNLKFLEKRVTDRDGTIRGHNDFWRPESGTWERLLINGTDPVYPSFDFNTLFLPDTE